MEAKTVFVELLRAIGTSRQFSSTIEICQSDIDAFTRAGLGPLLCFELERAGFLDRQDTSHKLRAASMTSRVMTRELMDNVRDVISLLRRCGIDVVVLKGVSYASRYYAEPHLRLMGDLDLLIVTGGIEKTEKALLDDGFERELSASTLDYDMHIHSAPLFSQRRQLWIEPHRRLIPDTFGASREAPLDLQQVDEEVDVIDVGGSRVSVLSAEFELVYLATGWYRDLAFGFESARSQRGLVDLTVMLQSTAKYLNWDRVLRWSHDTQIGACLYYMLSFLERLGAYTDSSEICRQLRARQSRVNSITTSTIHERLEKHVLTFGSYGRFSRAAVNQQLFCTLICDRPAWKNLMTVPWDLLFPTDQTNRYELRRLFRRVANLIGT